MKQLGETSPTLQALIAALESGDACQLESVRLSNRATLLPASGTDNTPSNLWGFNTESGFCPVEIRTKFSENIRLECDMFVAPTGTQLKTRGRPPKFIWQKSTDLIDAYLECEEISELLTVMQADLVPYSMAGDLGEEERKSACKNGIFTFTLEDPLLAALPENFDINAEGWEKFFAVPGYTKVSHMLTVNNRSLRWTHDFTATQWKHDFKEVHEKQQQQVHVIQQDAASGIQNRANVDNALGSKIHHPGSKLRSFKEPGKFRG